jgi:hypothetical protein
MFATYDIKTNDIKKDFGGNFEGYWHASLGDLVYIQLGTIVTSNT